MNKITTNIEWRQYYTLELKTFCLFTIWKIWKRDCASFTKIIFLDMGSIAQSVLYNAIWAGLCYDLEMRYSERHKV